MFLSKKGIVAVISIVFLMLLSIAVYIYLQNWYFNLDSNIKTDVYSKDIYSNLEVRKIDGSLLTIKNDFGDDLSISSILIDGVECNSHNYTIDEGIATIDIGSCTRGLSEVTPYSVALITNFGMVNSYETVRNPIISDLIVLFQFGACDFANGYIRLYGLNDLENSHVEIDGSSTYNVCIKHINFNLSKTGYVNTINLFYLDNDSNSAIWTQTGSRYSGEPPFWYNISISSDKTISYVINSSSMISQSYSCIGKIDEDNIYGSHMGDCSSSYPDTLWVKLI